MCRATRGASTFSAHAYGIAIDVNPFINPYQKGDLVLPELASAYLDRSWRRPGMILPGGVVRRAFAAVGWHWGGDFRSLSDRMHFSANGRSNRDDTRRRGCPSTDVGWSRNEPLQPHPTGPRRAR